MPTPPIGIARTQERLAGRMQKDELGNMGLALPEISLAIGITGHRSHHPIFAANSAAIADSLAELMALLGRLASEFTPEGEAAVLRLYSLLAYGADLMAVKIANQMKWPVIAPLPFGRPLNLAINAQPNNLEDMQSLLAGHNPAMPETAARAAEIRSADYRVSVFELAEQDDKAASLFAAHLAAPDDRAAEQAFFSLCSDRAATAAGVMIEQSDIVIGIWDGETHGAIGGTRHTIEAALDQGVPVIWIDARNPQGWRLLQAKEQMACLAEPEPQLRDEAEIAAVIKAAILPIGDRWQTVFELEKWRAKSNRLLHAYRLIENLFGNSGGDRFKSLTQRYEHPDRIIEGSGGAMVRAATALPDSDPRISTRIGSDVLRPFAWADGVSTWLSDAYRGSMVASFFLSAFAIIGGMAYLPFASIEQKWWFAAFEFVLLAAIIGIFVTGKRLRWHERWFEIRRVAEYFRHAPILLLLGASRSTGRWPRGADGNWPEWFARHSLRSIGLPEMKVSTPFLRQTLQLMLEQHVTPQMAYHRQKAARLERAQHNLDRFSELLFLFAVVSVALYLMVELGSARGLFPESLPHAIAKPFTFLGVLFPTLGGAFAGVHYFGDFERFAAISEITAEKLRDVATRIGILLSAPENEITFSRVSALAHAIDDIVVDEIENWQSVFAGKHITVPV